MNNSHSSQYNLRQVLQRAVIIGGSIFLIISISVSAYVMIKQTHLEQKKNELISQKTLTELIEPALKISDYMEIQRILKIVTKSDSTYSVITAQGDILLSDYSNIRMIRKIVDSGMLHSCYKLNSTTFTYDKNELNLFCNQINTANTTNPGNYLLNVKRNPGLLVSKYFVILVSILLFAFVLYILLIRFVIVSKILFPIEKLIGNLKRNIPYHGTTFIELNYDSQAPIDIELLRLAFNDLLKSIHENLKEKNKHEKKVELAKVASQLSHDIRSPLAALKAVKDSAFKNLSSDQTKLLNASINRITDIANTILPKHQIRQTSHISESHFLWAMIDQLVSEKRVQYKKIQDVGIDFSFEGSVVSLNAICDQTEFMRALSNIVDNAVEAKVNGRALKISLNLKEVNSEIHLMIRDNGKGISKNHIDRVFDEGFTVNKPEGSGLGLFQVKNSVEKWGGHISIDSEVGVGTTISINLVKGNCPDWLIQTVHIQNHEKIVLLDDEEYFFQIVEDKFKPYDIPTQYFKNVEEFKDYLKSENAKNPIYFIDHDLKQEQRGLDLIRELGLEDSAILLTGNYDDRDLQKKSIEYGVRILPKPLLYTVQII